MKHNDTILSALVCAYGVAASEYYESLVIFDAPEPTRQTFKDKCRGEMNDKLKAVLDYVEKNYRRESNES